MSLGRPPLDEAKKSIKPLKKFTCQKCQRLTNFFNMQSKTHNQFVTEMWVKRPHISINEKKLQNLDLKGKVN